MRIRTIACITAASIAGTSIMLALALDAGLPRPAVYGIAVFLAIFITFATIWAIDDSRAARRNNVVAFRHRTPQPPVDLTPVQGETVVFRRTALPAPPLALPAPGRDVA